MMWKSKEDKQYDDPRKPIVDTQFCIHNLILEDD